MIRARTQRLVEARVKAGFSQRAFARFVGVSSGYMSQIELGRRNVSPAVAKRICEALGVGFDELFELDVEDRSTARDSA
ncbi:helix-turn-helix transcriptional regulator [Thermaerobacter composti]|uniref:Helix-turn-helix transcriptional regulator n=1 Tax=Thermaerobacter composti TaxID=554949 RepID=A0ABZ0QKH8_9FIRM|nr:helix-turn-helix transcriptional regulator [Thermaerobacter composti]PZN04869.1 MAG: XRE family transcriptional regulator [Bacillota bacterium]WPD17982.1 helix-turn-helix transcriptional regulator [Thermaerobacter composti]